MIAELSELKTRLEELSVLVKRIDELVTVLSPKPKKEKVLQEPKEKKPRKVKIVIPLEEVKDATV
jgi:hypothetical protein